MRACGLLFIERKRETSLQFFSPSRKSDALAPLPQFRRRSFFELSKKKAPTSFFLFLLSPSSFSLSPLTSPHAGMGERPVRLPPELEDVPPRPLEVREKRAGRELTRKSPFFSPFSLLLQTKRACPSFSKARHALPADFLAPFLPERRQHDVVYSWEPGADADIGEKALA